MGKKVNPVGFRLPLGREWQSCWFTKKEKDYERSIQRDFALRSFLRSRLSSAGIAKIVIECVNDRVTATLHSARPGVVFGRKGAEIENLKKEVVKRFRCEISFDVIEVKQPNLNATLVAEDIAKQLSERKSFRRALRRAKQMAMKAGALGIRVRVSGRLGGVDIARAEKDSEGRVPLHTLRENIEYAGTDAYTTYGVCGVKVWLCLKNRNVFKNKALKEGAVHAVSA